MSTRAMVFIDGTWLAFTANRLADQHGLQGRTGGPLDFGALPRVCAQEVASQMAVKLGLDVVRTHYFGSIATNYDVVDQDAVQRRSEFFDSLRRHHRYEVYRYETDYRGHRVRRTPGDDGFSPPEKAVDVGLATALLEMAAVSAYDIAIVVCGDRDFVPALQAVRRLGKRVAIVSARGSCAREFSDPNDPMRVRDFDPMWLDTLWPQLVSPAARPTLRVADDAAREGAGDGSNAVPDVVSEAGYSAPISAGDSPYADDRVTVEAARGAAMSAATAPMGAELVSGTVTKVHANGYGFVRSDEGADYYFRRSDFNDQGEFARLERFRSRLSFRISEPARAGQAGRAAALAISGISDAPVAAPMRHHTPSQVPAYSPAQPTAYAAAHASVHPSAHPSAHSPAYAPSAAPLASADDLWAMDPFAAPVRRELPPPQQPVHPEPAMEVASDAHVAPAEVDVLPVAVAVDDATPEAAVEPNESVEAAVEVVTAPPKKKRATKKSVSA